MTEYRPNSNRFKEEQKQQDKKVEKVVTGTVVTRKKSGLSKFAGEFISEDAKNVKSYVIGDVLIPAVKKALCDIVTDGINMILYGGTRGGSNRSTADRVSYRNYYDRGSNSSSYRSTVNTGYYYDDIILNNRGEAENVLDRMDELMDTYGMVSVADLFDLVGVSCRSTDYGYGWKGSLRTAKVTRVRDGYMIDMPRAVPLD